MKRPTRLIAIAVAVLTLLLAASCPLANAIRSNSEKSRFQNKYNERRNLARGRSSHRGESDEMDNIFLRNNYTDTQEEGCACDGRRARRLGAANQTACSCENRGSSKESKSRSKGDSKSASYSTKSSKSNSSKGRSESTKGSKKESRSTDKEQSKGKPRSKGDDDDQLEPTNAPGTTMVPTSSPIDKPRNPPTNPPTNQPTNGQKPPPKEPVCSLDPNGLYGQKVGISTEFRFLYTTQTLAGITKEELNVDMLPKAEIQMGLDMLPSLFPGECVSPGTVGRRSAFGGSKRRQLQLASLNGMSIKPRDTVYEDGESIKVAQMFSMAKPLFVLTHE